MKYLLPVIFSFQSLICSAQVGGDNHNAIPVPKKKIKLSISHTGKPTLAWREIKMQESYLTANLINKLLKETKDGLHAFHGPNDSIRQAQETTSNQINFAELNPDKTNRILLLEEWNYDSLTGKMIVSILAVAPAYMQDKKYYPLFWNKYPDIISFLKSMESPSDHKQTRTMYEVFEDRLFTSSIIKY